MHRLLRRTLAASAALALAGCWDESGIVGSSSVTGTYILRTVNGAALPYTIAGSGANKTEVLDDSYSLYQGGTYSQTGHYRVTTNGQVTNTTVEKGGNYGALGTAVTLRPNDGSPNVQVMINANDLSRIDAGLSFSYSK